MQKLERDVGSLRGFDHPRAVVFIVKTDDGDVEIDLTPSANPEDSSYRPITEIVFE